MVDICVALTIVGIFASVIYVFVKFISYLSSLSSGKSRASAQGGLPGDKGAQDVTAAQQATGSVASGQAAAVPPASASQRSTASRPGWGEREITAKYADKCTRCTIPITPGTRIYWTKSKSTVRHVDCGAAKQEHEARELEQKKDRETDAFFKLLDRLNNAKGSAGRKGVLARAEEQIVTPELRLHLLLEASKLETDAVLEKVAGLKSKAVKRRRLEEALAAIRNDTLPDDMQTQQIALLEEALRTLDAEPEVEA
jgi:hypothetical protein